MPYRTRKVYRLPKQILYNNVNTNQLFGGYIKGDNMSFVGGYKVIHSGEIFTNKQNTLKRSRLVVPYTAGATEVFVSNPYPFAVGDALYEIGDSSENLVAERDAINNATAQAFGTITAVDANRTKQIYEITPASVAVGDIFSIILGWDFEGQNYAFTATTTNVADVTEGLYNSIIGKGEAHLDIANAVDISYDATKLTIASKAPGEIFTVEAAVVGTTGTLTVALAESVGKLTIAPDAGNGNHAIGDKIGTIDQYPLGIINGDYYLTDDEGLDRIADFAAYDMANLNKPALPYLDGQVVDALRRCAFFPPYALTA